MLTKYVITDANWLDMGPVPATIDNTTPWRLYYIISTSPPFSLNSPSQEILTEKVNLTGAVGAHLYVKTLYDGGVFAYREDDVITTEITDFIRTPVGMSLEDAIEAFKQALANISVLDITDPMPTFGIGNTNGNAEYLGMKLERGGADAFWVWDEAEDKFVAYLSGNDLTTKTLTEVKANRFYGSLEGRADTASKLYTPVNIEIEGDATGTVVFDGSENVSITIDISATGVGAGIYSKVTVGADGRVTAGGAINAGDVQTALGYTPYGVQDATSSNTANKLVLRDAQGSFSANAIYATEFFGTFRGTADIADKLSTPQAIRLEGDATGENDFDGTAPAVIPVVLSDTSITPDDYGQFVVDSKGRLTFARNINNSDVVTGLGYTPVNKAGDTITGNLTVGGDLIVNGDTVTINTSEISVEDAIITVAKDNTTATLPYAGIKVERGGTDAFFVWAESTDRFTVYTSLNDLTARALGNIQAANFYGALVGNADSASQAAKLTTPRNINNTPFDGTADISFQTNNVAEHASNRYFTEARVRASLSASGGISFNSATGEFTLTSGTAPVISVAGRTGAVVLDIADITNLQTELTKRPAATVSPTSLSTGATIPNTTSGLFYTLAAGTSTLVTVNLPATSGLPDGWHCFLLVTGLTYYDKTRIVGDVNINYRNWSSSNTFHLLGNNEIFKFTWYSALGNWVAQCIVQPIPIRVSRWHAGTGAWNGGSTAINALPFNQSSGNTLTFDLTASTYLRFPVCGIYYQTGGTQFSASAGGGVTGTAYIYGCALTSVQADQSFAMEYQTLVLNEDSKFMEAKWVSVANFGQVTAILYQTSTNLIYYYPDSDALTVRLLER